MELFTDDILLVKYWHLEYAKRCNVKDEKVKGRIFSFWKQAFNSYQVFNGVQMLIKWTDYQIEQSLPVFSYTIEMLFLASQPKMWPFIFLNQRLAYQFCKTRRFDTHPNQQGTKLHKVIKLGL